MVVLGLPRSAATGGLLPHLAVGTDQLALLVAAAALLLACCPALLLVSISWPCWSGASLPCCPGPPAGADRLVLLVRTGTVPLALMLQQDPTLPLVALAHRLASMRLPCPGPPAGPGPAAAGLALARTRWRRSAGPAGGGPGTEATGPGLAPPDGIEVVLEAVVLAPISWP